MRIDFCKVLAFAGLAAVATMQPGIASAATVNTSVIGSAGPWDITANPTLFYFPDLGNGPNTPPTVITGNFATGSTVTITASGIVNTGGGNPSNGPDGVAGTSTGASFPASYTSGPQQLGELIGAFANSTGTVIGSPFVVGAGGTFTATGTASELLLGINDVDFGNNTGSFSVSVSGAAVGAVPLPASAPMLGAALVALGAVGYAAKRKKPTAAA